MACKHLARVLGFLHTFAMHTVLVLVEPIAGNAVSMKLAGGSDGVAVAAVLVLIKALATGLFAVLVEHARVERPIAHRAVLVRIAALAAVARAVYVLLTHAHRFDALRTMPMHVGAIAAVAITMHVVLGARPSAARAVFMQIGATTVCHWAMHVYGQHWRGIGIESRAHLAKHVATAGVWAMMVQLMQRTAWHGAPHFGHVCRVGLAQHGSLYAVHVQPPVSSFTALHFQQCACLSTRSQAIQCRWYSD